MKVEVGEILKLKQESLTIFGLFWGNLGFPCEVPLDSNFVPEDQFKMCFQHLSFDKDHEEMVTAQDAGAMELILGDQIHA